MKNLYRKVALASVCTALGFALGANKEVKAATFILQDSGFFVADSNRDGLGDWYYGGVPLPVGNEGEDLPEYRAFYEFNVAQLSLASNTVIRSAIFTGFINSVETLDDTHYDPILAVIGYVGNGGADYSDFSKEGFIDAVPLRYSSAGTTFNLNVTTFVNQIVSNRESFAGFGFSSPPFYSNDYYRNFHNQITLGDYFYGGSSYSSASLTITTEPVPEPATIFGSVMGLGLGGWLKRKKSSQQNKITP